MADILNFPTPAGADTPIPAEIIDGEIAYLQALRSVVCGGAHSPEVFDASRKQSAVALNALIGEVATAAKANGRAGQVPALVMAAYRQAVMEMVCAAALLRPPAAPSPPVRLSDEPLQSNTDMPRLTLRAGLDEMVEAAHCGVAAMWRYASDRDAGYLVFDRPDGRTFIARSNKTSVTVWSQQAPSSNPFKTARAKP